MNDKSCIIQNFFIPDYIIDAVVHQIRKQKSFNKVTVMFAFCATSNILIQDIFIGCMLKKIAELEEKIKVLEKDKEKNEK